MGEEMNSIYMVLADRYAVAYAHKHFMEDQGSPTEMTHDFPLVRKASEDAREALIKAICELQAKFDRQVQITIEADALATERANELLAATEARERHTRQTLRTLLSGLETGKPAECKGGCPPQQICDYCQGPSGPDIKTEAPTVAAETFRSWLRREMPQGTVIGDPDWWVPRLMCAVKASLNSEPVTEPTTPKRVCGTCGGTGIVRGLHNWATGGTRDQACWNCHEVKPT
jgi:hypothetical protein